MIGEPSRPLSSSAKPVLSIREAIVVALLVGLAIAFAIPQLRSTYAGAVLSGTCRPDCSLPDVSIASPQYP